MPKRRDFDLDNYRYPDRFGQWLGYRIRKVDLKKHVAETELKIREIHLSPAARVHGGVVSAFFDFSCGAAVFTTLHKRDFCSTVEIKVNYLRPLSLGDHLHARCEVIFRGNRLCVVQGFLYLKGRKNPVAMATATFNIISAPTKAGSP